MNDQYRRIVVKVGTSTLTYSTGLINLRKIEKLVKCISDLQNSGKQIILVSSGAVSSGSAKIGISLHKLSLEEKQAAAAVGQCELINMYNTLFTPYGHKVAQILITRDVIDNEKRLQNAKSTFSKLLNFGCIPIVNENDSVSGEGISIGGNDILSAVVGFLCNADLVINLTDIDGLYSADPRTNPDAKLIPYVEKITDETRALCGGAGSLRGTGGMIAKLAAAEMCVTQNIPMIIANGSDPDILYEIIEGNYRGTFFAAYN